METAGRVCLLLCAPLIDSGLAEFLRSAISRRVDFVVSADEATRDAAVSAFAPIAGKGIAVESSLTPQLITKVDVLCLVDTREPVEWSALEAACAALDAHGDIDAVKCSRSEPTKALPIMERLSIQSLLVKAASGYWRLTDARYGVIALRTDALSRSLLQSNKLARAIPLVCELGLRQTNMLHLDIIDPCNRTQGGGLQRSVRFTSLMILFLRRIAIQYFVLDVNLATIYVLIGAAFFLGALCFGAFEWYQSSVTGIPRSAGTVMLALLPLLMGFQLLLNAILYDVQFASESVMPFARLRQPSSKR